MCHIPHPGSRAGPLPTLLPEAAWPVVPLHRPVLPFPGMRSCLFRFCFGGRKGRTNEEFALNAYFLKTINNQSSLKDHENCSEK